MSPAVMESRFLLPARIAFSLSLSLSGLAGSKVRADQKSSGGLGVFIVFAQGWVHTCPLLRGGRRVNRVPLKLQQVALDNAAWSQRERGRVLVQNASQAGVRAATAWRFTLEATP